MAASSPDADYERHMKSDAAVSDRRYLFCRCVYKPRQARKHRRQYLETWGVDKTTDTVVKPKFQAFLLSFYIVAFACVCYLNSIKLSGYTTVINALT